MRLHRAPTVTALLLAATLALAACSDDEPREPEPSPSATSTTAAPTPSPSAKPTEPVLPQAAKQPTEAGARAFIAYYWDLINYAQATGDVRALKKVSASGCTGCQAGIQGVASHYRDGGRVVGGAHSVTVSELKEIATKSGTAYGVHAVVTARHGDQTIVASDGTEDVRGPGSDTFDLYLLWVDNAAWRLDVMDLR